MEKTQAKLTDRSSNLSSRRYVLISPCRDEESYLRITIESVIDQTIQPTKWIVIDDNSVDKTPQILAEAASKYPFIKVIRRDRDGSRMVGPAVVDAFYVGYQTIDPNDFDYVCKFDTDLKIPPNYFEILMQRMEANPRIGTCSGKPYYQDQQKRLISEGCGDETSVGMTKFYRVECFQQIGGFVHQVMWDGIDCHRCRMHGWIPCSWDEPELRFIHLRPMGSSHKGILTGRMRHGFGQYFMGTGLLYILASAFYRMFRPPIIIGGLSILIGYLKSMLLREKRYDDPEFRKFLRRYQRNCLFKGKKRATRELNQMQAAKWMQPQEIEEFSSFK